MRDLRIIPINTGAAAFFYGDREGGGGGRAGWDLGRWCLEGEEEEGAGEELRRTGPRWEYHFFAFLAAEGCSRPLPRTHQAASGQGSGRPSRSACRAVTGADSGIEPARGSGSLSVIVRNCRALEWPGLEKVQKICYFVQSSEGKGCGKRKQRRARSWPDRSVMIGSYTVGVKNR